jgi:hypothetical protein
MRYLLICLHFLLACFAIQAQSTNVIKGKILQEKTLEPIAGASIFISNSTKGAVSDKDGSFEVVDAPVGNQQLVVSCIGYATETLAYTTADLPIEVDVHLKRKAAELASVTVEPDEEDGWKKYGEFFVRNFIGTTAEAAECKLKNHKVLRFRYSKKDKILTVLADEPLIIENKALGYTIQYQLEEFQYDYNYRFLSFVGYAYFKELPDGKEKTKKKWVENRQRAYNGSLQHFIKSLYDNRLAEEGFEVRRITLAPNIEKERVQKLMDAKIKSQRDRGPAVTLREGDSLTYYRRVLNQPDEVETKHEWLLTADSLVRPGDNPDEKFLFFQDYLEVRYLNEPSDQEYFGIIGSLAIPPKYQKSRLSMPNLIPIIINKDGLFHPLLHLITFEYWAWSEKLAGMRPID